MKKFGRIILPAILAMVALTGCRFDSDYDLRNVDDGDIQIGDVIEGPIGTATFHLEQLVGDLIELLSDNGVNTSEWDAGNPFTVGGFPQEYTTDGIDIDLSLGDDVTDILTGSGKLTLIVQSNSALSFGADIKIVFGDEGGAILDLATIEVDPNDKGITNIDITAETLEKIAKSSMLWINFKRDNNGDVTISKNDSLGFKLSIRKTGGISL